MNRSVFLVVLVLGACRPAAPIDQRGTPVKATVAIGSPVAPLGKDGAAGTPMESQTPEPGSPGTPGGLPDDRTPLVEPRGPTDPRSAQGAGQVVERYLALIGEGRFAEADKAWASGIDHNSLSPVLLSSHRQVRGEVGKPFDMEGAAGSIFIKVPVRVYGIDKDGISFNLVGPLTLRRVNDVDGASAAQLRWHLVTSEVSLDSASFGGAGR